MKLRNQAIFLNDDISLDLYNYQGNALFDLFSIEKIEIYFLDPYGKTPSNPEGRKLRATIESTDVQKIVAGQYRVTITLDSSLYQIGDYFDVWYVKHSSEDSRSYPVINSFSVYPAPAANVGSPLIHDINFTFSPKKMLYESIQYLTIGFYPLVRSQFGIKTLEQELLERFYFNLKSVGGLYVKLEMIEGCGYDPDNTLMNVKTDPEWEQVDISGDNEAHYLLDATSDTDKFQRGIYAVQFKALVNDQTILSDKFYLQIYD